MKTQIFRVFAAVTLLALSTAVLPAQENDDGPSKERNTLYVDAGPLIAGLLSGGYGGGIGYERALSDMFSVMLHADFIKVSLREKIADQDAFAFDVDLHGRLYPLGSALHRLYIDLGAGYGKLTRTIKYDSAYKEYNGDYSFSALTLAAQIGWKFMIEYGLFTEIFGGYAYPVILTEDKVPYAKDIELGGIKAGITLGWSF